MFTRVEENIDIVLNTCKKQGLNTGENILFGLVLVANLGLKALIQNIGDNNNACAFINDTETLNPNASCAMCKGRYLHGLKKHSYIYVGDKQSITAESVLKRMETAQNTILSRLKD